MCSEENNYFSLDLKLPSSINRKYKPILRSKTQTFTNLLESSVISPNAVDKSSKQNSFGFTDMLENIHGCNLRENNPWLNPFSTRIRKKYKEVRFATMEVYDGELPHCRNYVGKARRETLHTLSCTNIEFETVDVLGQQHWQHRQFILGLSERLDNA